MHTLIFLIQKLHLKLIWYSKMYPPTWLYLINLLPFVGRASVLNSGWELTSLVGQIHDKMVVLDEELSSVNFSVSIS